MFPTPPRPTETNLLEEPSFSRKETTSETSTDGSELRPTDDRRMFPDPPRPEDVNGSRVVDMESRRDGERAMMVKHETWSKEGEEELHEHQDRPCLNNDLRNPYLYHVSLPTAVNIAFPGPVEQI